LNANAPTTASTTELEESLELFRTRFATLTAELQRAVVGYEEMISDCLVSVFCQGHVLLEGVPGLGKTFLVRMLARALSLGFGRVQCTPDLMPADILGTHIVGEDSTGRRSFRFEKGPVFTNLLLVDEINRATPKTQAAFLEAMQEKRVTAGGECFELPRPFFVLATQNPIEMEGTYPLPEAQLDRFFFKLLVPFPGREDLVEISRRTTGFEEPDLQAVLSGEDIINCQELLTQVPVADPLAGYAASLVLATHPDGEAALESVKRFVSYGASPRGLQTLIRAARAYCALAGRTAVSVEDIRRALKPALRHRVVLNFEGEAEALNMDTLLDEIIAVVPTPAGPAA
jgi:MoxR-like ATPase